MQPSDGEEHTLSPEAHALAQMHALMIVCRQTVVSIASLDAWSRLAMLAYELRLIIVERVEFLETMQLFVGKPLCDTGIMDVQQLVLVQQLHLA